MKRNIYENISIPIRILDITIGVLLAILAFIIGTAF